MEMSLFGIWASMTFLCLFIMSVGFAMMFAGRIQLMRADARNGQPWANDPEIVALAYGGLVASIALAVMLPVVFYLKLWPMILLI